jgi:hypothetical protein
MAAESTETTGKSEEQEVKEPSNAGVCISSTSVAIAEEYYAVTLLHVTHPM